MGVLVLVTDAGVVDQEQTKMFLNPDLAQSYYDNLWKDAEAEHNASTSEPFNREDYEAGTGKAIEFHQVDFVGEVEIQEVRDGREKLLQFIRRYFSIYSLFVPFYGDGEAKCVESLLPNLADAQVIELLDNLNSLFIAVSNLYGIENLADYGDDVPF